MIRETGKGSPKALKRRLTSLPEGHLEETQMFSGRTEPPFWAPIVRSDIEGG